MSGLVGLWNLDGQPVDAALFGRMSEALRHRGRDGRRHVITGPLALAHHHLWVTPEEVDERQPLSGGRGALLVLDGRVDNRDELIARLDLPRTASDGTCVLAAYQRWGEVALERLSGDFALGLYDPARPSLWLVRDAVGLKPLHYHHGAGFFAFASEIKAMLPHPSVPCRPDDEGLADYLLLGWRPEARPDVTAFSEVRSLPPGHVLRVTPRGADAPRQYWDFDPAFDLRLRTIDEYAEAYRERFATAVRRRVRSGYPVAVSVSGGLDSSSILCQAETDRRAGVPGSCPALLGFSYTGPEGSTSDERMYLAEIERAYGIEIARIAAAPLLGLMEGAGSQAFHAEAPLLDSLWQITHALQQAAGAAGARRFVTGHWGDQMLHGTAYLVDLIGGFRWATARRHVAALDRWFEPDEARNLRKQVALELARHHAPVALLPVLKWVRRATRGGVGKRWLAPAFRERALRGANRPAALGHRCQSAHARSLYVETRMKYSVQCMEWNDKVAALHGLDYATPFLDRDLIQFLMAVPGEVQNAHGVPRALARQGLAGVLPEGIRRRRWKADYSEPVNQGAARDLVAVRALFADSPRSVSLGYVDRARLSADLDRLASRLAAPDCVASWELADLIGLESWLRVFFDRGGERR